jgi:hypothetical protein
LKNEPLARQSSFWSGTEFKRGLPEGWTFADFVNNLIADSLPRGNDGARPYLVGLSMTHSPALEEFQQGFEEPPFLPKNLLSASTLARLLQDVTGLGFHGLELFVGGPDSPKSPTLHVDSLCVDVFSYCLLGKKQFFLLPPETPEEQLYLFPSPDPRTGIFRFSKIQLQSDLKNPDVVRFARFDSALEEHALVATLTPGTLLYVPPSWWHCAHNLEPTVTVTWRSIGSRPQLIQMLGDLLKIVRWRLFKVGARRPSSSTPFCGRQGFRE